jgi:hypothetical protein
MRVDKGRKSFCLVQSHDTLHNDTQHNSIQPIDHNRKKHGTQHNDTKHESLDARIVVPSVSITNVMLSVGMLSVTRPFETGLV